MLDLARKKIEERDRDYEAQCLNHVYKSKTYSLDNSNVPRCNIALLSEDKLTLKVVTTKRGYSFIKANGDEFTEEEVLKVNERLSPMGKLDQWSVYRTVKEVFPNYDSLLISAFEGLDALFLIKFREKYDLEFYKAADKFHLKNVEMGEDFSFTGESLCLEGVSFCGDRKIQCRVKELVLLDCTLPELYPDKYYEASLTLEGAAEKLSIIGAVAGRCRVGGVINQAGLKLCDSNGEPTQIEFISAWNERRRPLENKEIFEIFEGSTFCDDNIRAVMDYVEEEKWKRSNKLLKNIESELDIEQEKMEKAFKVLAHSEKVIWTLKELNKKSGVFSSIVYGVTSPLMLLYLKKKNETETKLDDACEKLVSLEHQRRMVIGKEDADCIGVIYEDDELKFIYDSENSQEGENANSYEFDQGECVKELVGEGVPERLNEYVAEYFDNMRDMLSALLDSGAEKTKEGELIDLTDDEALPGEVKSLLNMGKKSSRFVRLRTNK